MTQIKATPTFKDVVYATASATQKLDVYLPEGDGPFPLIINVHGGGFMMGDKSNPASADEFLAAGYAVASVDYRLSGEALAPAQIQDVKAAVRFLRANAEQYKLDPQQFAAFGQSAGGNLAALLGTSCGAAALEGADLGNADQSSCVQAVVDWFGPTDFLQMDQQFAGTSCPVTHDAADSPESLARRRADPDRARQGPARQPDHLRLRRGARLPDPTRHRRLQRAAAAGPTAVRRAEGRRFKQGHVDLP